MDIKALGYRIFVDEYLKKVRLYTQDYFLAFSMLLRNVLAVAMLNEYLRFLKPQIQGIQRTEIFFIRHTEPRQ